jgi:UDP-N-acetyl-2-amino-2-deoxyglucuronate dehydrogenase
VTVRIGILGAGNISETHARAAAAIPGVDVVAVHGDNAARAAQLASAYGAVAYPDFESFLRHPMDVVAIGSPSGLHAAQGIAAAGRGLHVLTEKPIDVTPESADRLIDAARRANVKLGVFFQDRAQPDIVRLHAAVAQGRLGRPLLASARVKWYRPPDYYGRSRWRGTWALDGGGALMNQGIHTLDLVSWLLGPVVRVTAATRTAFHQIEVEDTVVAILEFDGGAVATFEATTAAYPGYKRRLELTGTEGTLILEHDRLVAADLKTPADDLVGGVATDGNVSASSPVVSDARGHQRILEDFIAAIREDREPLCGGPEGRRSVALAAAIYHAARTGRPVDLVPL